MNSKIAFLDRDGTLIENAHYLSDPAGVKLLAGTVSGLLDLRRLGFRLVMVSNQSGVGRGYFAESAVHRVNQRLQDLLEVHGAQLDLLLFCPHQPEANCRCRKPQPGLVEEACRRLGLGLEGAIVVGDSDCDMQLARGLGIPGYRVGTVELDGLDGLARLLNQL
ncbi:MAG: HAD family hydrolase [Vulcanimicrobiota bacterium]